MQSTRTNAAGTLPAMLIGAFFAARAAITLVCARWLGLDPQVGASAQILLGFLLFSLLCFHSLGAAALSSRTVLRPPAIRWVLIFLLFSLLSFAWSGAVSPIASFAYWCGLAIDVAMMLLLVRGVKFSAHTEALLRGYIYAACVLAALAWAMPTQDDLRLGDIDYFNTNQIGNLCALAFFFAQYLERSDRGRWTIAKAVLLITLLRSLSKTTLAAMIVSQSVLFLRDNSISRARKAWIILGVLCAGALFWGLFVAYFTIYTTTGNQAETLTGRTAIWAFALDTALTKPWFGNGFDALWHVIPPLGPDRFEARHAENEVLQQFFAYGFMGILLLAGIYGSFFRQVQRVGERPRRLVLFSLLIYILVRGLAEAEPFDLLLPLWSIVLFSVLSADGFPVPPSLKALESKQTHVWTT
jgi:exopolysaccharide production protein ExoQ